MVVIVLFDNGASFFGILGDVHELDDILQNNLELTIPF
jgi:hypothetical protein